MKSESKANLDDALQIYLKSWGPLRWKDDLAGPLSANMRPYVDSIIALSAVETDSRVIVRKVRAAGIDADDRIADFIYPWLAEEAEHGRALAALADIYGAVERPPVRRDRLPTLHNMLAWPTLCALRGLRKPVQAAYCTLGASQEFIALTTYNYLADAIGPGFAGYSILKDMARQEGRHMSFYMSGARHFLADRRVAALARKIFVRTWAPVGIDALGPARWWQAFSPLVSDPAFRAKLERMDSTIQSLPGMSQVAPVSRFLTVNAGRVGGYAGEPLYSTAPSV